MRYWKPSWKPIWFTSVSNIFQRWCFITGLIQGYKKQEFRMSVSSSGSVPGFLTTSTTFFKYALFFKMFRNFILTWLYRIHVVSHPLIACKNKVFLAIALSLALGGEEIFWELFSFAWFQKLNLEKSEKANEDDQKIYIFYNDYQVVMVKCYTESSFGNNT